MQILDNGMVKICRTSKGTGEQQCIVVEPQELPAYGIPYSEYQKEQEAYEKLFGEGLTEKEEGKLSTAAGLGAQLLTLETERRQMEKRGPTEGYIPAQLPFVGTLEEEAGGFETARNLTAYRIADVLADQTGKSVSDVEFKAFRNSLPKRTDSDYIAWDKMNATVSLLEDKLRGEGIDDTTIEAVVGSARVSLEEIKPEKGTTAPAAPIAPPTTPPTKQTGLSDWLLQKGAKVQQSLGESQVLPRAYGAAGLILGGAAGHPHIGAGMGYAGGERLKQLLQTGDFGDIQQQKQAAMKGVGAGALSKVGQVGFEKVGAPLIGKVARKPLQWLLQKTGGAATTPTAGAIEAVKSGAGRLASASETGSAAESKRLLDWLMQQGKRIPTLASKQELVSGYQQMGTPGKGLYDYFSKQLAQQAPATKPINALLSAGYKEILPSWLKRWLGYSAVGTAAGAAGYRAGR